jgi:hypothetical protein
LEPSGSCPKCGNPSDIRSGGGSEAQFILAAKGWTHYPKIWFTDSNKKMNLNSTYCT